MNTSLAIKTTACLDRTSLVGGGTRIRASHTEKYNTAPGQQKTKRYHMSVHYDCFLFPRHSQAAPLLSESTWCFDGTLPLSPA